MSYDDDIREPLETPQSLAVYRCRRCGRDSQRYHTMPQPELIKATESGTVPSLDLRADCCAFPFAVLVGTARTVFAALADVGMRCEPLPAAPAGRQTGAERRER